MDDPIQTSRRWSDRLNPVVIKDFRQMRAGWLLYIFITTVYGSVMVIPLATGLYTEKLAPAAFIGRHYCFLVAAMFVPALVQKTIERCEEGYSLDPLFIQAMGFRAYLRGKVLSTLWLAIACYLPATLLIGLACATTDKLTLGRTVLLTVTDLFAIVFLTMISTCYLFTEQRSMRGFFTSMAALPGLGLGLIGTTGLYYMDLSDLSLLPIWGLPAAWAITLGSAVITWRLVLSGRWHNDQQVEPPWWYIRVLPEWR